MCVCIYIYIYIYIYIHIYWVCADAGPRIDLVECLHGECYKSYPDNSCRFVSRGGSYMQQERDYFCSDSRSVSFLCLPKDKSVCQLAAFTCVKNTTMIARRQGLCLSYVSPRRCISNSHVKSLRYASFVCLPKECVSVTCASHVCHLHA